MSPMLERFVVSARHYSSSVRSRRRFVVLAEFAPPRPRKPVAGDAVRLGIGRCVRFASVQSVGVPLTAPDPAGAGLVPVVGSSWLAAVSAGALAPTTGALPQELTDGTGNLVIYEGVSSPCHRLLTFEVYV